MVYLEGYRAYRACVRGASAPLAAKDFSSSECNTMRCSSQLQASRPDGLLQQICGLFSNCSSA